MTDLQRLTQRYLKEGSGEETRQAVERLAADVLGLIEETVRSSEEPDPEKIKSMVLSLVSEDYLRAKLIYLSMNDEDWKVFLDEVETLHLKGHPVQGCQNILQTVIGWAEGWILDEILANSMHTYLCPVITPEKTWELIKEHSNIESFHLNLSFRMACRQSEQLARWVYSLGTVEPKRFHTRASEVEPKRFHTRASEVEGYVVQMACKESIKDERLELAKWLHSLVPLSDDDARKLCLMAIEREKLELAQWLYSIRTKEWSFSSLFCRDPSQSLPMIQWIYSIGVGQMCLAHGWKSVCLKADLEKIDWFCTLPEIDQRMLDGVLVELWEPRGVDERRLAVTKILVHHGADLRVLRCRSNVDKARTQWIVEAVRCKKKSARSCA